ncbi:MAG TPA: hypothetical protein VMM38_07860 [Aridibacter sp.]|nr:hypothetical protein [Aridibacter sp.]
MDIFQAAIIYLACGTPFGAHYLLNRKSRSHRFLKAVGVTLFWFAYLPTLLHKIVTRRLNAQGISAAGRKVPGVPVEVSECSRAIESAAVRFGLGIYEVRNAVERFAGMSRLDNADEDCEPPRLAALSEIAGHPDPRLSGAIIERRNRSTVERHRRQATCELLHLHAQLSTSVERDREVDAAFIYLFELSGNTTAAKQIRNGKEKRSKDSEHVNRPRALRPLWRSLRQERAMKDRSVTLNKISMTSSLQSED